MKKIVVVGAVAAVLGLFTATPAHAASITPSGSPINCTHALCYLDR